MYSEYYDIMKAEHKIYFNVNWAEYVMQQYWSADTNQKLHLLFREILLPKSMAIR